MSSIEQNAEQVADRALERFKDEWRRHAGGFPGGTNGFLAVYVDRCIDEAASELGVTGGAVMWARQRFAAKAQTFFAEESSGAKSNKPTTCSRCKKAFAASTRACPRCGYTPWGSIAGTGLFWAAVLIAAIIGHSYFQNVIAQILLVWGCGLMGCVGVIVIIDEIIKTMRTSKEYRGKQAL